MINTVLFDLDGVLVDFCDDHYLALNQALYEVCYESLTYDEHIAVFNALTTRKKLEMLVKMNRIKDSDKDKIYQLKQKYTQERIEKIQQDPSKMRIMQWLFDNNYKIGCVTNSIRSSAEKMLEKVGVLPYMNVVVTNEDVVRNKPFPDPYLYACKLLALDNTYDVLVVEDSPKGIESAVNALCNVLTVANAKEVTLDKIRKEIAKLDRVTDPETTLF